MNATILTATILVGNKETPLTKAIVAQVPVAESEFIDNDRFRSNLPGRNGVAECDVLGEVQIDNGRSTAYGYWLLVSTPRGLRKIDTHYKPALAKILHEEGRGRIERIILVK